ncbi:MAG: ABC transporter ATP-binding protein [Candidatus Lindowbacteria bacterium]|nr:ABC transporter ATP-binding protein [Candidatus Lindowbacteria bacterium]
MSEYALVVKELRKSFGNVRAVDGISFSIRRGAVFCLVGPNGAGKTTTMEIIEGLRAPDSGEILLLGMSLPRELSRAKQLMGIQLQTTSLFDRLKVGEIVNLFRSFYERPVPAEQLLSAISLDSKVDQMVAELSGGQQQRLAVALALVNDPEILFLDEPTAGLDPQARREVWRLIQSLKQRGKTVFLTTHYMDEAEKLSDEVAIIDHGRIIARDTPRNLVSKLNRANVVEFSVGDVAVPDRFPQLRNATTVNIVGTNIVVYTADITACMLELLNVSHERGFDLKDMQFRNPSLEDVFLELTGRMLRE